MKDRNELIYVKERAEKCMKISVTLFVVFCLVLGLAKVIAAKAGMLFEHNLSDIDNVYENTEVVIDYRNTGKGYVNVKYKLPINDNEKLFLNVNSPTGHDDMYEMTPENWLTAPLSDGDGTYDITIGTCEIAFTGDDIITYISKTGTSKDRYAIFNHTPFKKSIDVKLENPYAPFLTANCRVNYDEDTLCVKKAAILCADAESDIEKVEKIHAWVVQSIEYDHKYKNTSCITYFTDLDETYESRKGVCIDYAALMAAMLRSQGIPCKLECGSVWPSDSESGHAWVSVYVKEGGEVADGIYLKGNQWNRMDPTFIATTKNYEHTIERISDDENYDVERVA